MTIHNHRLYLSSFTLINDINALTKESGIAVYSKCVGLFLKCFGYAEKVKEGKLVFYVNKKSYAEFKNRYLAMSTRESNERISINGSEETRTSHPIPATDSKEAGGKRTLDLNYQAISHLNSFTKQKPRKELLPNLEKPQESPKESMNMKIKEEKLEACKKAQERLLKGVETLKLRLQEQINRLGEEAEISLKIKISEAKALIKNGEDLFQEMKKVQEKIQQSNKRADLDGYLDLFEKIENQAKDYFTSASSLVNDLTVKASKPHPV